MENWIKPLWGFLLLGVVLVINIIISRRQNYKTGDPVCIIADDERKYIVIRYHRWLPCCAICKRVDKPEVILIHQKYLTHYQEPRINPTVRPNINKAIPFFRIIHL